MEMPNNVEELTAFVDSRIDEYKPDRVSPAVRKFKKSLDAWLATMEPRERNQQRNAVYAVIKARLGISTIMKLQDEQVPTATAAFEQYKQLVQPSQASK